VTQRWDADVAIIGTGAGGGTLAHALKDSGARVLLLERGGFLPQEEENWSARAVFGERRYRAREVWRDGDGRDFHPGVHYFVGGALSRQRDHVRGRLRRGELRRAAAGLGRRGPSRRSRQLVGPGRAQLHGPRAHGADGSRSTTHQFDTLPEGDRRQRLRPRTPPIPTAV